MTDRSKLLKVQKLINKTQQLISSLLDAQPQQTPGMPPEPAKYRSVEKGLLKVWAKLKAKGQFTAADAKQVAGMNDSYLKSRSDSAYSSTLSRWASEGYLKVVEQGSGPRPTVYSVRN